MCYAVNCGDMAVNVLGGNSGSTNSDANHHNWAAIFVCNSDVKTTIRGWAFSWAFLGFSEDQGSTG